MDKRIRKAGVIGAGVMGANIAAQLANVGIETLLLDIVPVPTEDEIKQGIDLNSPEFRNRLAEKGLENARKASPASFYISRNEDLITTGNLEDDIDKLKDVQLIIEAVVENSGIKRDLYKKLDKILNPGTIITSNTSGISAETLCEGLSENFRRYFAITHFFNPPRYMKLLEVVPGPDTLPEVIELIVENCENFVGKRVVYAKDTPNFIANRIGVYSVLGAINALYDMRLNIETVDNLTGTLIGSPKSATFRTADMVGLDTLLKVAENVYKNAGDDECRDMFKPPEVMKKMIDKGLLGEKSGSGFYKKDRDTQGNRIILSLKTESMEYAPRESIKFDSLKEAENIANLRERLKFLYYGDDLAGQFTFRTQSETLIYAARRIPEISDDIVNIDNAIKWGFNKELGPFEIWDCIGLKRSVLKMKDAGYDIPGWVELMLEKGFESFYKKEGIKVYYYDPESQDYKELYSNPRIILLPALKEREKKIAGNDEASLIDLEDGVACLEFHSKMNSLGEDVIKMVIQSADIVSKDFNGLVIANHGVNFSAGANLALVLITAQAKEWDKLEWMIRTFQDSFMTLKYLDKPVVAAPAGLAIGGGCEICMAADRVRFAAETYMGLVEAGVGLIPAGGGSKELLIRNTEHLFDVKKGGVYQKQIEMLPFVAKTFETIALAKTSTSGPEALELGYLRKTDHMTVNRDFLINDAKNTILAMNLEGYEAPRPLDSIRVAGEDTMAVLKLAIWTMHEQGYATDHDVTVSNKLAHVLCGGNVFADTRVSEQYILDLEREAFLSLCGDEKTQARMQYMLMTGKPLRN
jgi:3-hydroxyacyl-CoA dehydrogenase